MGQAAETFTKDYWEQHWEESHDGAAAHGEGAPNPHVVHGTAGLRVGAALDAGCGTGAEAIWLAARGWQVTGADISAAALADAAANAATKDALAGSLTWVEADLTSWEPGRQYDLVTTSYAHPAMPQLAFYRRIAEWVAPGGTLLIVGHLHHAANEGHSHHPPAEATVTLADITAILDPAVWSIEGAQEATRTLAAPDGRLVTLQDAVVRATRSV